MDSLRPGDPRRVGHYVLMGRLGAGGMGVVAVRTDPANARPLLEQAVEAAGHDPAHVAEIAVVVASTDPARADQVASTMKAGAGTTAGYRRARALAGLANVCFGSGAR